MRMGTTPTHTFQLPEELSGKIAKVRVIYNQGDTTVLKKEINGIAGTVVSYRLSQEETLKFQPNKPVLLQMRALTLGGDSLVSDVITVSIHQCLENEVFK